MSEDKAQIKAIIEALLFVCDEPLNAKKIKEILGRDDLKDSDIKFYIEELNQNFSETKRVFTISCVAGGYQIKTLAEFSPWISKLFNNQKKERLSKPALETLAIVSYRQPIIRADIEAIRGVDVGGMLGSLMEKGLIKITGRRDIAGRPFVYETTQRFLEYFGLSSLNDLPDKSKFKAQMDQKLDLMSNQAGVKADEMIQGELGYE